MLKINVEKIHNCTAGVLVDIKKAFDTMDYNILLEKLGYYGIKSFVIY